MLASAAAQAGSTLFLPARVGSCTKSPGGQWALEVAQEGALLNLSGRMLVDATGRKAMLASRLGARAHVADRLIGAVSFSDTSETAQWTLIEAVEDGWWYSVPLPGASTPSREKPTRTATPPRAKPARVGDPGAGGPGAGMVFAYMTDADLWNDGKWDELLPLAPLTFERAGCRKIPPPSQIVSAASVVRCPVTSLDWMAAGDAALAFDPLSGQGVFKSIETGTRCGSAIAKYFAGEPNALVEYEAWVNETYRSYLSTRKQFYGSVARWPGSRFWKRRASGGDAKETRVMVTY
jgi:hypothetical protein